MIYLLTDGSNLKVGYTSNLEKRLKQYSTHLCNPIILDYKDGELEDEAALHKLLDKFLIRNEWFKYDQQVIDTFHNFVCKEKLILPEPVIGEFVSLKEANCSESFVDMDKTNSYNLYKNVLKLQDLTGNEKIILTIILSYYSNGQQFNMSNNTLSIEAGMDYSSVMRCIKSLKEKGYLKTYRVMHKNSNKIAGRIATPQKEFLLSESNKTFDAYEYEEY